jgi:hypothetical protein
LILVPKARSNGASLLATIILGATSAHLFSHVSPAVPMMLFLLSSIVVWGPWRELAHVGRAFVG